MGITNATYNLSISRDILDSARITIEELRLELAISLYVQRRLSIGKARELADKTLLEFRKILAARKIPVHYDASDLQDDLETIQRIHSNDSSK
jgi:predicted HTH domain antitoxin